MGVFGDVDIVVEVSEIEAYDARIHSKRRSNEDKTDEIITIFILQNSRDSLD